MDTITALCKRFTATREQVSTFEAEVKSLEAQLAKAKKELWAAEACLREAQDLVLAELGISIDE